MKTFSLTFLVVASALTLGLTAPANAQLTVRHPHRANTTNVQALAALQTDLQNAITSMTAALPIYDGNRVKSIHAAFRSLVIVDRALAGNRAMARTKPTVKDKIPSKKAKQKYSAQQISASQVSMQQGLAALNQAMSDLVAAAGANPGKRSIEVNNHLKVAITEAQTAINLHGGTTTTVRSGIQAGFSHP